MCRICGYIDFSNKYNFETNQRIISEMKDSMFNGGPDDSGTFVEVDNERVIAFGHRRLSIIDVTTGGHQPMKSEDGKVIIIFNGEIYNYLEIRTELSKEGFVFKTNSDTEVIINAYLKWGISCVEKFIGMFSFVLLDKKLQLVYFIRDRAGVKPLHYYFQDNILLFSSELKGIYQHPKFKKAINPDSVSLFFQFNAIPNPYTIYQGVFKVKQGTYLKLNLLSKELQQYEYWSPFQHLNETLSLSEEEFVQETESILKSACEYRMVSDVPVGVFLSGGYDSTLVSAILQKERTEKLKTFSIGFESKQYDESGYAKKISEYLQTDHTEWICTESDVVELLPKMPEVYDEPFGDDSSIPTYLVSKLAKQKVKVALSADGGDEVFGGYNKYIEVINFYNRYRKIPSFVKRYASQIINSLDLDEMLSGYHQHSFARKLNFIKRISDSDSLSVLLNELVKNLDEVTIKNHLTINQRKISINGARLLSSSLDKSINHMLAFDYSSYLPDTILTKVDRATMANSIEGREPLLDHRLIEWSCKIPPSLKFNGGSKKHILKTITHKYVPKHLVDRPKKGFSLPVENWMDGCLKQFIDHYLDEKLINSYGVLKSDYIQKVRKDLKRNTRSSQFLWNALMFQMWFEKWM